MPDISMCSGLYCELKKYCYRYTAKPEKYQSYMGFYEEKKEKEPCNYYVPNKKGEQYGNRKI